jgi:hypothetical protein
MPCNIGMNTEEHSARITNTDIGHRPLEGGVQIECSVPSTSSIARSALTWL